MISVSEQGLRYWVYHRRHTRLELSKLFFPHIDTLGKALENCHKICDQLWQFQVEA